MKILFSFLRIGSVVWATHVIPDGDWAIFMVAAVWGLTVLLEG